VDRNAGGAEVAGFLGASEDGSHVYFVARGQLVPGRGKTLAQNKSAKAYSVYGEQDGAVSFVGAIGEDELVRATFEDGPGFMDSQVSPDGRYLLFESNVSSTPYEAGNGAAEAYLYDADSGSEATVCVSCRQDGETSVEPTGYDATELGVIEGASNPLYTTHNLVEQGGAAQVYFTSYDSLAPGAVAGAANIYEWSHGQVFHIATEPADLLTPENVKVGKQAIQFVGASADGADLYFTSPQALNWENSEERWAVYDARIGGGFPEPPPPSPPCDPDSEGSCQAAASAPQTPAQAASATFGGSGNLLVPLVPGATVPAKPKLTRVQQLAKALRACHRYKKKVRRVACEKRARSKYRPARKAKAKAQTKAKSHKGGK
jgi:hypothetical protein